MSAKVTPAEAKAVWDSLEEPSCRKVADKFKAAGRPVSFKTVNEWRNKGWGAKTAAQIEASASNAVEKINVALPVLTGDVNAKIEDVATPLPDPAPAAADAPVRTVTAPAQPAEPDDRTNAERAEDALLAAITGATSVWNSITQIATAKPPDGMAVDKDTPPLVLLMAPEGVAKLMKAASEAISRAIEDYKQIPALRAETAASIPGTQTVYAPGEGPHADGDFPLRSAMEAFDAALKGIRERKP